MSTGKQLAIVTLMSFATLAPATAHASRVNTGQEGWRAQQSKLATHQPLWQDTAASLFTTLPANLQTANSSHPTAERVAYWGPYRGWYGPAYPYSDWGNPRYYNRRGAVYNAYYGGYPDYYYGPRVCVRVYPNGDYSGRYYW